MKLSASKKVIWILELTDNEMAVLYNCIAKKNPVDFNDITVLDELRRLFIETAIEETK